jgi:hypothetical protein
MRVTYIKLACVVVIGTVAACAPAPKVLPPPVVRTIPVPPSPPRMPYPPGGASAATKIPLLGIDGVRETPNRLLSREETIWHFRSALNVAALNCRGPIWDQLATNYNKFILLHKARLAQTTKTVDAEFKKRYPNENALRVRDTKSTELYNYFALPPVKQEFCDTAMRKVQEALTLPTPTLPEYSVGALADLDGIFIRFFDAYAQYERDLADWNQRYAPRSVMTAPQPVPSTTASTPVKKPGT